MTRVGRCKERNAAHNSEAGEGICDDGAKGERVKAKKTGPTRSHDATGDAPRGLLGRQGKHRGPVRAEE